MKMRKCELCNADAAVYCPSDAAFLCCTCDAKVHQANFLVARHLRRLICSHCNTFTAGLVSGVGFRPSAAACPSCPQEDDDSDTGSSSCVSSTTSPASKVYSDDCSSTAKRRRTSSRSRVVGHEKAEGIFVNWCGKLGVESGSVVGAACRGMKVCVDQLPYRVCLAASMWLGLRLSLEKSVLTWKVLKRLEEISGVPAKIILAAESKLGRAVRGRGKVVELQHRHRHRHRHLVEGSAEC